MKAKLLDFDDSSECLYEFNSDYFSNFKLDGLDDIEPFDSLGPNETFPFKNPFNYKRTRKQNGYFDYINDRNKACIKKEYHRMKVIRGHNRAIRSVLSNKVPKRTINKMNGSNNFQLNSWKTFKDYILANLQHFKTISTTKNMPKTDGVAKKTIEEKSMAYKSYNSKFCFEYFFDKRTLKSFLNYCEFIFDGFEPKELCERFTYRCCECRKHNENCRISWQKLKNFTRYEMFLELGLSF